MIATILIIVGLLWLTAFVCGCLGMMLMDVSEWATLFLMIAQITFFFGGVLLLFDMVAAFGYALGIHVEVHVG